MAAVSGEGLIPLGFLAGTTLDGATELVVGLLRNLEGAVAPVQLLAGELSFLCAKGSTVNTGGVRFVGGAVTDGGGHLDDRRLIGDGLGGCDCFGDGIHIGVSIRHVLYMPAVGLVALQHILGERHVGAAVDRDVVVVVEGN